ncbi:hypothetical protein ACFQHO_29255 [Actinomadura yumaensis]
MIARRIPDAARDRDTSADDCALDFLCDLDESLWILEDTRRAEGNAFRDAARQRDHINELRRLLRRLHDVLLDWETDALSPDHPDHPSRPLTAYDKPVAVRSSSGRPPAGVAGLGSQGRGLRGRASAIM